MAISFQSINLIRTKTSISPQYEAIELSLRKTGLIGIIAFLCASFLIGIVYLLINAEYTSLKSEKTTVLRELSQYAKSEVYYRAIKDRTKIVTAVMATQHPWSQLLDRVTNSIAGPPILTSITVDDQNRIVIMLTTETIESMLNAVNAVITQAQEKALTKPTLVSFQIDDKGKVQVSISFFSVFTNENTQ